MESRLPKPTKLKRPVTNVQKTILPMERIKAHSSLVNNNRLPLSQNLLNFNNTFSMIKKPKYGGSPDFLKTKKSNLRRSRSACDLRSETFKTSGLRTLKQMESTLASIPARFAVHNLRRSRSACEIRADSRPLKRTQPTLASIPAKSARIDIQKTATTSLNNCVGSNKNSSVAVKKAAPCKTTAIKRIPPYDYKARFNDLLEKHKTLKVKYDEARDQLTHLDTLPEQYEEAQNELYTLKEKLKNGKTEMECLQRQNNAQTIKITSLTKDLQKTKEEFEKLTEKYEKIFSEHTDLFKETTEMRESNKDMKESITFMTHEIDICKEELFKANIGRKELHNTIMDLRGNIRVFCRVRPPLDSENDLILCNWNYLDECTLEIQNLEIIASGQKNKTASHVFSFDHVFHSKSRQQDVFEMVSPLIQSALDGYNICIFAYGQTGSGKTFTMDGIYNNVGVIPRTVDLIFESIENYKRMGWLYVIKATFLEIYNEVLYDLLSNEQKEMEIRMANKYNKTDILVTNITEAKVQSANHLRELMNIAKMNRATASTAANERSSRSHAVTRIQLVGKHEEKNEISVGTINLVDLAGSESPKTSIRMNETKNINRSLSELTNVILALLQKQDHVPYRNSKLTHLLMPSLDGNSKTLMFINVSPFQDCYVESVKSLRFASSVNSCKMAKAKKNKFLNTSGANVQ